MTKLSDGPQQLLAALDPILARVAALDLPAKTSASEVEDVQAALEREFPYAGEQIQAIGALLARGVDEGWLADRGAPESRFSRVAKPTDQTHDLSVDVVSMVGSGLEHTHLAGEVTLGFPAGDPTKSCQFEGREPGWVVLGPDSRHIPTVDGERMNLIYFLPGGAVKWHR